MYNDMPYEYRIDSDFPAEYVGAVHAGMRLWDEITVEQAMRFKGFGKYRHDYAIYNSDNVSQNIVHATDQHYQEWDGEKLVDTDYIAIAVPRVGAEEMVLDCDIYIFNFQTNFVDGRWDYNYEGRVVNLVQTVAHEVGHCLGIFHSQDPASIMYPTSHLKAAALGWDFVEISADDATEFYTRYPWLTPFLDDWWSIFSNQSLLQGLPRIAPRPTLSHSSAGNLDDAPPLTCKEIHLVSELGNTIVAHALRSPSP